MRFVFSLIINSLVKNLGVFLLGWIKNLQLIRKGIKKEKLEQFKRNERAKKHAEKVREEVDDTNIVDVRDRLRKRTNRE